VTKKAAFEELFTSLCNRLRRLPPIPVYFSIVTSVPLTRIHKKKKWADEVEEEEEKAEGVAYL
jgi:hypothetical protein